MNNLPTVTVVIPTYNAERTLRGCLESIEKQDYPKEKLDIAIADGGSSDSTIKIVDEFKNLSAIRYTLYTNPLKTGEAGKAIGAKQSRGDIIGFIDSDNILESKDWLKRMVTPFKDADIIASEPLYYTYREEDPFITRYGALLGMNDPLCLFLGNYDRYSFLTGKWTDVPVQQTDEGEFLSIRLLDKFRLPTIGANGFLIRKETLLQHSIGDYLFDIDIIAELADRRDIKIAKVKIGIVHLFADTVSTWMRKQRRRIKDYLYFSEKNTRKFPWQKLNKWRLIGFFLYCALIFPLLIQSVMGCIHKAERVWFFHPIACWITLLIYAGVYSKSFLFGVKLEDRKRWGQ